MRLIDTLPVPPDTSRKVYHEFSEFLDFLIEIHSGIPHTQIQYSLTHKGKWHSWP